MAKQVFNPFLPLDVYIPDGEPHVFNDRVYLYGSHDKEGGDTYCMLDYEVYSAPVDNLKNWSSKGVSYRASQDPLSKETNRPYLFAPDCVRGNDGKYYLYYSLSGEKGNGGYHGPISVAVCDEPDGKFEFLGYVKFKDGTVCKRFVPFDPAVMNDNGTIRLYYGTWYPFDEMFGKRHLKKTQASMFGKTLEEIKSYKTGCMGAISCTLADDMLTIVEEPKQILPVKTKGTPFESKLYIKPKDGQRFMGHGFFEGSSIRKINNKYYFIYSSMNNHELCYAISNYPDKEFKYMGTIVSNGDIGYKGRLPKDRLNHTATTHGSIENINGQWYVFYHRQTHGTDYSRQACAEKIKILKDGSIPQVEITSCGLNDGNLEGVGTYPAVICCNLTNGKMPHGGNSTFIGIPMITNDGEERFIKDMSKNTIASYKYFDLSKTNKVVIKARGNGVLSVLVDDSKCSEKIIESKKWSEHEFNLNGKGHAKLSFKVENGMLDIISFELKQKNYK